MQYYKPHIRRSILTTIKGQLVRCRHYINNITAHQAYLQIAYLESIVMLLLVFQNIIHIATYVAS